MWSVMGRSASGFPQGCAGSGAERQSLTVRECQSRGFFGPFLKRLFFVELFDPGEKGEGTLYAAPMPMIMKQVFPFLFVR